MLTKILHLLVSQPLVYDLVQRATGFKTFVREIAPFLELTSGRRVLDVGAGTGNLRSLLPDDARYVWLDSDPQKLAGFRTKYPNELAVLADGSAICLKDESVGYAVCVAISHHCPDEVFDGLLREISRVTAERFIFLDALRVDSSPVSRLLWRYDRGRNPRTEAELRGFLERYFEIERVGHYAVYHKYMVCLARPRRMETTSK
jgi:ubiquinone/menaquinone biosynthesis C-methylase UbiE